LGPVCARTRAHPLNPAALAFVSYGIVLVRVRVLTREKHLSERYKQENPDRGYHYFMGKDSYYPTREQTSHSGGGSGGCDGAASSKKKKGSKAEKVL
jgi:hypothetical protein